MSKVEMSLSEYNSLMEVKRLLEESNSKLEQSYNENKKLQEEKIKALKDHTNSVTIVKETRSYVSTIKAKNSITNIIERMSNIVNHFKGYIGGNAKTYKSIHDAMSSGDNEEIMRRIFGCVFDIEFVETSSDDLTKNLSMSLEKWQEEKLIELRELAEQSVEDKIYRLERSLKEHKGALDEINTVRQSLEDARNALTECEIKLDEVTEDRDGYMADSSLARYHMGQIKAISNKGVMGLFGNRKFEQILNSIELFQSQLHKKTP